MKKTISFVLSIIMMLAIATSLTACNDKKTEPDVNQSSMSFAEFEWPATDIAKLIPEPKSKIGKIDWSESYGFVIYVSETSREDYSAYVSECEGKGFTVNSNKGEDYFWADNSDGYKVTVRHQDGNVMFIRMDEPKKDSDSSSNTSEPAQNPEDTTNNTDIKYIEMIPDPESIFKTGKITVTDQDGGKAYIFNVTNYSDGEFESFVSGCKEKGFTDISYETSHEKGKDFGAYSSDGKYWVQVNLDTENKIIYVTCQQSKKK